MNERVFRRRKDKIEEVQTTINNKRKRLLLSSSWGVEDLINSIPKEKNKTEWTDECLKFLDETDWSLQNAKDHNISYHHLHRKTNLSVDIVADIEESRKKLQDCR